ncbi:MAG: HD family phosphohydrolase [Myxococcaceae bacterium]
MSDPAGPPLPEPSPLDALAARLRLAPEWVGPVTHGTILLLVSVAAAFVISPGLYGQQLPQLGADDVGKPFQSNSPSGFKAGRDYEVVDNTETEELRQDARNNVAPVFDYNPAVTSEVRAAIQESFAAMQEVVSTYRTELALEKVSARPPPAANPDDPDAAPAPKPKRGDPEGDPEALSNRLRAERKLFEQKLLALEDEDFQALVAARFSDEVELATTALIERAYPARVSASTRDELIQLGAKGITVRILGGTSEELRPVASPGVMDVREARAEVDRFASLPGNLLPDAPANLRRAVLRLAKRQLRPNLTINTAETKIRRDQQAALVKDAVTQIKKGLKVIGDGELVTEKHRVIVAAMRAQTDQLDLFQLQLGGTALVGLLIACCYAFNRAAFRRFRPTRKDALLLGTLLVAVLALVNIWVTVADAVHDKYSQRLPAEALYYCIPVAAGAMLVRFILSEELALFFAIVVSLLAGVLMGNSLSFGIFSLVTSLVAADRITKAKDRVGIFKAGVTTGLVSILTVLIFSLAEAKGLSTDTVITGVFAFLGAALAVPVMVMALTPLIEASFGYASDIKLLELANLNHPALKELIVQAPGTYHHSIIIGSLVEGAAEAIGANPLLARSCAYYHDIGKGRNPLYFGENQKGENRHDTLAPAMSAVIIKRHVTEGMEMARQYKLPKLVSDAIPQHHGTRLVGFFFHKAMKEQEGKENPQPIDESIYRYNGPKPQFREAALVMIADAVEAASRAMPEPTSVKLQALVQKLINLIFSEGQLDECDLTLKDLNLIAGSFVRTLEGIYHARPAYPPGAMTGRPATPGVTDPKTPILLPGPKPDGKRSASS